MSKFLPSIETWKRSAQQAASHLRRFPTKQKNEYLKSLAKKLLAAEAEILAANEIDVQKATEAHSAFVDRLTLNPARLALMTESLNQVADLADPVGEELENRILPNALRLRKVRSPLGVIFMIFESRPNVITEAFSLAFKSGNAILLRGGSESAKTAAVIYRLMHETASDLKMEFSPFVAIEVYDRELVTELLTRKDFIDVVVPRGGDRLIEFVNDNAKMPIIKNDRGMCHCYVDEAADLSMVTPIVINAKTQRPGVCNSLETLLLHKSIAAQILPQIFEASGSAGLEWRLDEACQDLLGSGQSRTKAATTKDWDTEHLAQILNCRVVESFEEALVHIAQHGSKHSEAIITKNESLARRFQNEVDAAAVYWNASTRFTDGFEFGLGGELGISTQKLHVRGPVGLRELTSARWLIDGSGQIRS